MAIDMDRFTLSGLGELRWCAMRRRVRAAVAGETTVDSRDALQVWEPYRVVGFYAVPIGDVSPGLVDPVAVAPAEHRPPILTPDDAFLLHTCPGTAWTIPITDRPLVAAAFTPDDPDLRGHAVLDWSAFDEWRDEEKAVLAHPHDPFKRIDCLDTSRHVVVRIDDVVLAESNRPTLLLETHLPERHYLPREDIRMDLLVAGDTHTTCAYKGHASYWSAVVHGRTVADVAWCYPDPLIDGEPVRDLICFDGDRVEITVDGIAG
ncbi:DUF427 domain-containing protein [Gordonia hankookensis]|uniref:DUF427 domain-containing protein n=1 Tax=Gordonia hankookensis TaxID=589403 RepID=A0ABR7WG82_9ACTN|nr:DUF427 domain-containing protein [Gordonia hankookensis]MBD1321761.1 DUF427 domain-containing protein [Gordonia hankookensis]